MARFREESGFFCGPARINTDKFWFTLALRVVCPHARYHNTNRGAGDESLDLGFNFRARQRPARSEQLQQLHQKRTIYVLQNRTSLFVANSMSLGSVRLDRLMIV